MQRIDAYCKHFGYVTEVMGASFRTREQILALAGCDLLTISPELLHQLQHSTQTVERKLSAQAVPHQGVKRLMLDEPSFRYPLNDDAMTTRKATGGIHCFAAGQA